MCVCLYTVDSVIVFTLPLKELGIWEVMWYFIIMSLVWRGFKFETQFWLDQNLCAFSPLNNSIFKGASDNKDEIIGQRLNFSSILLIHLVSCVA